MKRYLLLLTGFISCSAAAEDSWVSLPASPSVPPAITTESGVIDNSQMEVATTQELATNQSDLLSELLMQLEQMQQELSQLRELVEQNKQSLTQTVEIQQQRYLDVDRRLSSLTKQLLINPSSSTSPSEANPEAVATGRPKLANVSDVADYEGVEAAYQSAMSQLRNKDFTAASQSFSTFSKRFAGHPLVANSLYWQAEVLLVEQQLKEAAELFQRVLDQYPDHSKAADAAYKLGVTFHRQGNTAQAQQQLQAVIRQYKNSSSSTAELAQQYLEKL